MMIDPMGDAVRSTSEIMALRQDVASRILAEAAAHDNNGRSEVVIAMIFFVIFGAVIGVVGTLAVQAILR